MSDIKLKKSGVLTPPGAPKVGEGSTPGTSASSTTVKNPSKVGATAVKMPKSKKLPDAFGKPSLFFKNESFDNIKRPSIEKLRDFLEKRKGGIRQ